MNAVVGPILVANEAEPSSAKAVLEADAENAAALQLRQEVYEQVLVVRRDSAGGFVSVQLFREVPCHSLSLFLPDHELKIAKSEQVLFVHRSQP